MKPAVKKNRIEIISALSPAGWLALVVSVFVSVFVSMFVSLDAAHAVPSGLTFQGRLINNGQPVENAVILTVIVKAPAAQDSCTLYQESHSINMANSDGIFTVRIGGGTRGGDDRGFSLTQVFSGSGVPLNGLVCNGGTTSYTPQPGHTRSVYVSFNDNGNIVAFNDPYIIQSVPYAIESERLAGKPATSFLQTTTDTTQGKLNDLMVPTTYSDLLALINGTSAQYMRSSTTEGTSVPVLPGPPGTLSAGKMWYEAGALKYYDATTSTVRTLGSGGGGVTNVATGTGLTGGPITTTGTISIATSGVGTAQIADGAVTDVKIGGVASSKLSGALPAISGASLTDLNATNIASGTLDAARLPSSVIMNNGNSGAVTIGTNTAAGLTLETSGSARMTVLSTGEIGIGEASPNRLLHVNGPIRIAPAALPAVPAVGDLAFDSGQSNAFKFYDGASWQTVGTGSGAGDFRRDGSLAMTGAFNAGGHSLLGNTTASANLVLESTSNATKGFVVLQPNGGNVGIGNASPDERLAVTGTLKVATGQAYVAAQVSSSASPLVFNANSGNMLRWSTNEENPVISLQNLRAGGSYMLVVKGTGTGQITMTCYSDTGGSSLPISFVPSNGPRGSGSLGKSIYHVVSDGENCLVSWSSGF